MELKGNIEGVSLEEYWLNKKIENEHNEILVTQELLDKAKIYINYVKERTGEA